VALKLLDTGVDTRCPPGDLFFQVLGSIGEMLREARRRDAKPKGRPSARRLASQVLALKAEGLDATEIARRLDIGVASVYRILTAQARAGKVEQLAREGVNHSEIARRLGISRRSVVRMLKAADETARAEKAEARRRNQTPASIRQSRNALLLAAAARQARSAALRSEVVALVRGWLDQDLVHSCVDVARRLDETIRPDRAARWSPTVVNGILAREAPEIRALFVRRAQHAHADFRVRSAALRSKVAALARDWVDRGLARSLRDVARRLDETIPPFRRKGERWRIGTLHRMLQREAPDIVARLKATPLPPPAVPATIAALLPELIRAGPTNGERLAKTLNRRKIAGPRGGRWDGARVRKMGGRIDPTLLALLLDPARPSVHSNSWEKATAARRAQYRALCRKVVRLARRWLHQGTIHDFVKKLDQTVRLSRRQRSGRWQQRVVLAMLRRDAPDLLLPRSPYYVSAADLARELGVERAAVYRAVYSGVLPHERRGRKIIFRRDVVAQAIQMMRISATMTHTIFNTTYSPNNQQQIQITTTYPSCFSPGVQNPMTESAVDANFASLRPDRRSGAQTQTVAIKAKSSSTRGGVQIASMPIDQGPVGNLYGHDVDIWIRSDIYRLHEHFADTKLINGQDAVPLGLDPNGRDVAGEIDPTKLPGPMRLLYERYRDAPSAHRPAGTGAHLYARVSKEEQARPEKFSIGEQIRLGRRILAGAGIAIIREWRDEGYTGKSRLCERPVGSQMFQSARPGEIVVVHRLDRLSRNTALGLADCDALRRRGVGLLVAADGQWYPPYGVVELDPMAELRLQQGIMFAQLERDLMMARTEGARRALVARGYWPYGKGGAPFRWRADNESVGSKLLKLVPDEYELEVAALLQRCHRRGDKAEKIARTLNNAGYHNRRGRPFKRSGVQGLITRLGLGRRGKQRSGSRKSATSTGNLTIAAASPAGVAAVLDQKLKDAERVLPVIRDLVEKQGCTSLRMVADGLNHLEVPAARGGHWFASAVTNALAALGKRFDDLVPANTKSNLPRRPDRAERAEIRRLYALPERPGRGR
jgi:DNA invertase Pin-like site-specific DNA recombinase